jgi:hypothetical protein
MALTPERKYLAWQVNSCSGGPDILFGSFTYGYFCQLTASMADAADLDTTFSARLNWGPQ